jgi:DNA-binding CsgD family transcriptional regulator
MGVIQQDYGLTRMEAVVALQLLNNQGLKAVAAHLGIAPTTVRTHLTAVFDKTGTRRQVDLVRLLLQNGRLVRDL